MTASALAQVEAEMKKLRRNLKKAVRENEALKDRIRLLQRDLNDCLNAAQTIFHRCACGRIAENGIICPSNQEKPGSCEKGL